MLAAAMASLYSVFKVSTQGPVVVEKSKGQTRQSGPAATAAETGFCGSLHLEAFRILEGFLPTRCWVPAT